MEGRETEVSHLKDAIRKLELASITHDDTARRSLVLEAEVSLTFSRSDHRTGSLVPVVGTIGTTPSEASRGGFGAQREFAPVEDNGQGILTAYNNRGGDGVSPTESAEAWREHLHKYYRQDVELTNKLRAHLAEEYEDPDAGISDRHKAMAIIVVSCIFAAALIAAVSAWL